VFQEIVAEFVVIFDPIRLDMIGSEVGVVAEMETDWEELLPAAS
jgi:hypothetical protein